MPWVFWKCFLNCFGFSGSALSYLREFWVFGLAFGGVLGSLEVYCFSGSVLGFLEVFSVFWKAFFVFWNCFSFAEVSWVF